MSPIETPAAMTFVPVGDGHELRRGDAVVGRLGQPNDAGTSAEVGSSRWRLVIEGDRDALAATWQAVARDDGGEQSACYYHGSVRGGRIVMGDLRGSLRRGLGLATEWRLRVHPDAALTLRPSASPAGPVLDLEYVASSAEMPELLLLLICWSVVAEESIGPARVAG